MQIHVIYWSSTTDSIFVVFIHHSFPSPLSRSLSLRITNLPQWVFNITHIMLLCFALFYSTSLCSNNMLRPKPRRCTHIRTHILLNCMVLLFRKLYVKIESASARGVHTKVTLFSVASGGSMGRGFKIIYKMLKGSIYALSLSLWKWPRCLT